MISELSRRAYEVILRSDLGYFAERCFCELNPQTPFLTNWHIEVIIFVSEIRQAVDTIRICLVSRTFLIRVERRSALGAVIARPAPIVVASAPCSTSITTIKTFHAPPRSANVPRCRPAHSRGRSCPCRPRRCRFRLFAGRHGRIDGHDDARHLRC